MTDGISSGMPAGPAGCRGATIAIAIVLILIAAFLALIWWTVRDVSPP